MRGGSITTLRSLLIILAAVVVLGESDETDRTKWVTLDADACPSERAILPAINEQMQHLDHVTEKLLQMAKLRHAFPLTGYYPTNSTLPTLTVGQSVCVAIPDGLENWWQKIHFGLTLLKPKSLLALPKREYDRYSKVVYSLHETIQSLLKKQDMHVQLDQFMLQSNEMELLQRCNEYPVFNTPPMPDKVKSSLNRRVKNVTDYRIRWEPRALYADASASPSDLSAWPLCGHNRSVITCEYDLRRRFAQGEIDQCELDGEGVPSVYRRKWYSVGDANHSWARAMTLGFAMLGHNGFEQIRGYCGDGVNETRRAIDYQKPNRYSVSLKLMYDMTRTMNGTSIFTAKWQRILSIRLRQLLKFMEHRGYVYDFKAHGALPPDAIYLDLRTGYWSVGGYDFTTMRQLAVAAHPLWSDVGMVCQYNAILLNPMWETTFGIGMDQFLSHVNEDTLQKLESQAKRNRTIQTL